MGTKWKPKSPIPVPDDLRQLAEMRGLKLTPFKAHGEILFFVQCDGELVYSGNSFDGRDLREFWLGEKL